MKRSTSPNYLSGLNGQQLDDIVQTAVLKRSLTMDMVTKKLSQANTLVSGKAQKHILQWPIPLLQDIILKLKK